MKVAVSSEGPGLESQVDPRFGRAGGFVIVDMDTMQADYVDNGASQAAAQGAGIQTAERLASTCIRTWTTAAWAKPCAVLPMARSARPRLPTSRLVCVL